MARPDLRRAGPVTATDVPRTARPADAGPEPEPRPGVRTLRAPATRDQVDAHRFGQRRLEAALVRADPVPLHEQLRSQRRAAFAGVLLGLLGLGAAALLGKWGDGTDWRSQELVVGSRSGTVYAVTPADPAGLAAGQQRLVPVANTVAGRMVRAALGAPAPSAVPVEVAEDEIAGAPRTPPAAVAGAVGVRPDGPAVPPQWAVCDTNPDPAAGGTGTTTVLAGALGPSAPSPGLLLTARGGSTSVVLDGVRHRIDPDDTAAMSALGLLGVGVREVGDGLLSALPEGAPLRTPDVVGDAEVPGLGRAGDVVVSNPLGGGEVYFVVLGPRAGRAGGVLPVPATLADAVRARTGQGEPAVVAEGLVAQNTVDGGLDTAGWPTARMPRTDPASVPTVCVTWRDGRTGLSAGDRLPSAAGAVAVDLSGADGAGPRVDSVVLPASGAGPVESRGSTGGGTRWLLSSSGALYGVADDPTAAALGVTTAGPAPDQMLRLLPRAGPLDLGAVREVADLPGLG